MLLQQLLQLSLQQIHSNSCHASCGEVEEVALDDVAYSNEAQEQALVQDEDLQEMQQQMPLQQ